MDRVRVDPVRELDCSWRQRQTPAVTDGVNALRLFTDSVFSPSSMSSHLKAHNNVHLPHFLFVFSARTDLHPNAFVERTTPKREHPHCVARIRIKVSARHASKMVHALKMKINLKVICLDILADSAASRELLEDPECMGRAGFFDIPGEIYNAKMI